MTNDEIAAMTWGLFDAEKLRRELAERIAVETALRNALSDAEARIKELESRGDTGNG